MDDLEQWINEAEEQIQNPEFNGADVKAVGDLAEEQLRLMRLIDRIEEVLATAKKALRNVQWVLLPDAMAAAGISKFDMTNGSQIQIKDYLHCDLGKMDGAQKGAMFDWLIKHRHDEIINTNLPYKLARGQYEDAIAIKNMVEREFHVTAPVYHDVHWQTLDKWARGMREQGEPFPEDIFNLIVGRQAKIKVKS